MIQRTQEKATSVREKFGWEGKERKMLQDKNSPKKSNGSQESLQQDVKQKEPKPIAQTNFANGKVAPLISNSYS